MQETDGIVRTKVKNMRLCQMIQRGECEACAHHGTGSRKLENYPHHIDAMLTYKSRHVHRRLAIKIRFTDYCCLRQAIVARIVAQKLIICRS